MLRVIGYGLDIPVVYFFGDSFIEREEVEGSEILMVGLKEPFHILESRTSRFRPLVAGISLGHAMITAGTLGWFGRISGRNVMLTNAHVAHPNPCSKRAPAVLDVLQPGPYDGGVIVLDTVGYYHSHVPLGDKSECPLANLVVKSLNALSKALGRKTRFTTYVERVADADVALVSVRDDVELNPLVLYNDSLRVNPVEKGWKFAGLLFAGGGDRSIITRADVILRHYPELNLYGVSVANLEPGMRVIKCGRTTGCTEGVVETSNAVVKVTGYLCGEVVFENVAVAILESKGGDSGSAVWVVE